MDKFCAVIPAAGSGSRMGPGQNKLFIDLGDRPVLYYSIEAFVNAGIKEIILVTGAGEKGRFEDFLSEYSFDGVKTVEGGASRGESVYNGLCAADGQYCLIHDGARPLVDEGVIKRCMDAVLEHDAAIAAVPAKDTVKIADADGFVDNTPRRERLFLAQTPQGFRLSLIKEAYERAINEGYIASVTDDASAVELFGGKVFISEGDYSNIKITEPKDLLVAQAFLDRRMQD